MPDIAIGITNFSIKTKESIGRGHKIAWHSPRVRNNSSLRILNVKKNCVRSHKHNGMTSNCECGAVVSPEDNGHQNFERNENKRTTRPICTKPYPYCTTCG